MTAELPPRLRALPPAAEINEARAYSKEEVAALLSVSPEFVYKQCREGVLRHCYLGKGRGMLRIPHAALLEYLAAREH